MHPDWEAIAAIGQIVGAGAVVLPLLFPGHQLRQNTRSVRGSSRARVTEILTSTIAEIQRGDFADVLVEGFAGYRRSSRPGWSRGWTWKRAMRSRPS